MPTVASAEFVLEVFALARSAKVDLCLDGGWGIDALLGQQTRDHSDLDVILDADHLDRCLRALEPLHTTRNPGGTATQFVLTDPEGRSIDIHAISFDERGFGHFSLPKGGTWPFPPSAFNGQGTILGQPVRCLSAQAQVQCHGQGYPPTEKDVRDMQLLQERWEVVLPLLFYQSK